MKNNYRFFQNKDCEYFPCHETQDTASFNCLFCYCPLYCKEKCIGKPRYLLNVKGQEIKDCSECMVVHQIDMYEKVLEALQRQDKEITINVWNLREQIWERMSEIASWKQMDIEMFRQHRAMAISSITKVMEKQKHLYRISILLQPFSNECIKEGYFLFGKQKILCNVLEKIDKSQVTTGYLYAFHAPDLQIDQDNSLLTQYYLEIFQIACMDVIREWIQTYLQRKHSIEQTHFCSPSFGPGYFGMEIDAVQQLLELLDTKRIGIEWKNEKMYPIMSLVGIYLVSRQDLLQSCKDCVSCVGQDGGCAFCSNSRK